MRKDGHPEKAAEVLDMLRPHAAVAYDQAGSIGRRYRRQDEIGTPLGVTVDYQTLDDDTVTIRDRDTMEQSRISIADLTAYVKERIAPPAANHPLRPSA
jgi:glycyl-tRNA synthetase